MEYNAPRTKLNPTSVLKHELFLSQYEMTNQRIVYSLMDYLGDMGGIYELVVRALGVFIFSISNHSFIVSSMKRMFLVKTENNKMFKERRVDDECQGSMGVGKYLS